MRIDTPIPKQVFVDKFRDELLGMVLDALANEKQAVPLALMVRAKQAKIDSLLGLMHEFLTQAATTSVAVVPLNGRK